MEEIMLGYEDFFSFQDEGSQKNYALNIEFRIE